MPVPQPLSPASPASPVPVGSLGDKLRLAASKGQLEKIQELVDAGAGFEPDRVSNLINKNQFQTFPQKFICNGQGKDLFDKSLDPVITEIC